MGLRRCWGPVTSPRMAAILAAIVDLTQKLEIIKNGEVDNFLC